MNNWNINFRFTSSAGGTAQAQQVKASGNGFARMIVNDVAISASERMYQSARRALIKSTRETVAKQVRRMARSIPNLAVQDNYAGPYGRMFLSTDFEGGKSISDQGAALGWRPDWNRRDMGIKWAKRSRGYLKRKQKEGTDGYWFRRHGPLQRYLESRTAADYLEDFGPLQVHFTRAPGGKNRSFSDTSPISSSKGGRLSKTVQVGRLEVVVFGNITPEMLPGLSGMNPKGAPKGAGVAQLLPHNDETWKLVQPAHNGSFRPAIDPFVSFYLTRAIPNAVWKRTERFVSEPSTAGWFSGTKSSLGREFG